MTTWPPAPISHRALQSRHRHGCISGLSGIMNARRLDWHRGQRPVGGTERDHRIDIGSRLRAGGTRSARLHAAVNRSNELVNADWLAQDAGHIQISQIVGRARDDDHRDLATDRLRGKLLSDRDAVEAGQTQIQQDKARRPLIEHPQRFDAVASLSSVESLQPERCSPQHPQWCVVFDDEDESLRAQRCSCSRRTDRQTRIRRAIRTPAY
jgi:hypothetical protein